MAIGGRDERSEAVEESLAATLRFPGGRLAQFTISYGAASADTLRLVGTKGDLCLDSAYDYAEPAELCLTVGGRTKEKSYKRHDQFAAEIEHFSQCIRTGEPPEPSGREGLADLRVIEALRRSIAENRPVAVAAADPGARPQRGQELAIGRRRESKDLVHAEQPEAEEGQ